MFIFANMATWLWVLILALAMFPIIFGKKRRCEHRGRFRIGGMLVALIAVGGVLLFFLGTQRYKARWEDRVYIGSNIPAPAVVEAVHPQPPSDPSLEALWERLTKSRINLDANATGSVADPASEESKDVVKDKSGLDDQGNVPPQWVITPPKRVGQVYRESIASDPWATENECRRQLEQEQLPQAIARRIEQVAAGRVGRPVAVEIPVPPAYDHGQIPSPPGYAQTSATASVKPIVEGVSPIALGIGPDYILREICRDEFTATVDSSVGEMKKVHVLLEFDENIDNYLVDAWLRHERQIRFASVGKAAALSLTGLAAIYGLLRFDTWSKGYYSKQLLIGGTLAIIGLVALVLKT